jgi:hypothetical protein
MKKRKVSVAELRRAGWGVRVRHHREEYDDGSPKPKGGSTVVFLSSPNNHKFWGSSVCSNKDAFNRKLGLEIALGRAMKGIKKEIKS